MTLPRVRRVFCCPYCSFVSQAAEQVRSHTISQHAVQPKFCCPLCQEQLMGRPNLRFHLTHIHNVVSECVERLLLVASTVETTFPTKVLPSPNLPKVRDPPDTSSSLSAPDGPKDPGDGGLADSSESSCEKIPDGSPANKELAARDAAEAEDPEEAEKDEAEKDLGIVPCPLCRQRAESFPELREHLENEHPELSHTEIQQLCGPAEVASVHGEEEEEMEEEEEEEMEDGIGRSSSSPPEVAVMEEKQVPADLEATTTAPTIAAPSILLDPRQPVSYRKSTNFALDKFLDPSRPYKCTICKESFTQKNILLVHYNSVSHLHKMKKASIDPSLPSRAEVSTAQDKPFKCTICRVSYNQSSTLEIHMRSVLHQTRSRVAKLEAAGRSTPDPNNTSGAEKLDNAGSGGNNAEHGGKNAPAPSSSPKCETNPTEMKAETAVSRDPLSAEPMRKVLESQCLGVPGLPFVSPQMHLSMDLHRQASLLQSPLFTPPMLPPFPLGPETLLKLQQHQQQLLLPFYLHDLKVNPDIGMQGGPSILSLPGAGPMLIGGGSLMKPPSVMVKDEPQQPMTAPSSSSAFSSARSTLVASDPAAVAESETPIDNGSASSSAKEDSAGAQEPTPLGTETSEIVKEEPPPQPGDSKAKGSDHEQAANAMPPPRVPTDVSRTASKALLENFGFELVIQYNEGKQHLLPAHPTMFPPQPAPQPARPLRGSSREQGGRSEKLKCESCGKLFSNMLILKTHEEHVHRRFLPFEALSRYAAQFRKSYDSMYAPKQQTATTHSETQSTQKIPQPPPETQPQPAQIPQLPIPLDFSLCPSYLMQPLSLQAMPPALPTMEELMSAAALAQAQTGDPAETETSESRSPRTRITPEQLKVLWNYFDINNLPSEEKILQMSEHTGLAAKVVKHWFRNRLFKERQQDKDSPYNFSTPPSAAALPEGEEIGEGAPAAGGAPQTTNADLSRCDRWGSRRFSRTKFSDFQFQALQSFFETSAYPKDSEVEKLSQHLGLPNRVVVVWFQNARQKARKNAADSPFHAGEKGKELGGGDRCVISGSKQSACKKCHLTFPCIFKLIQHLKKCYNDQLAEDDAEEGLGAQEVPMGTGCTSEEPPSSTAVLPPPEPTEAQAPQEDVTTQNLTPNEEEETQMEEEVVEGPEGVTIEKEGDVDKVEELTQAAETAQDQPSEELEPEPETEPEAAPEMSSPILAEQPPPAEQTSISPPPQPSTPPTEPPQSSESAHIYSCDQCQVSFANADLLGKHQSLHILASAQLPGHLLDMPLLMFDHNSSLLAGSLLPSNFGALPSPLGDHMTVAARKRKHDEDSLSPTESEAGYLGDEQPKDKRLRTTILPEQLEILHRWYMQDSNPTRKMLDRISEEVALKKRVVQVWFQNTRARERKGQFRCVAPISSPKPYAKFIPLGKPEPLRDLPRHMVEASPAPLLTHRSPSLQILRETAAFYYSAAGIHCAVPPTASPKGNPAPCQAAPPTQTFIMKTEACFAAREPAMPDPAPAEPATADSSAVSTQEATEEASGADEPVPPPAGATVADTDESNQRMSPPPATMEADERSPGDLSDSSSMADPESPNPGNAQHRYSDGGMDALGQRRFRTQMSSLQLKIMKACYANYRTPTMNECEMLGNEIGLQKRVIQVWFQNARAKEKKAKLQGLPPPMGLDVCSDVPRTECTYCHIKYDFYVSCRSHIFSRQHIAKLREAIQKQLKHEIKYYDLAPASSAGGGNQQLKTELKQGPVLTGSGGHPTGYTSMGFQNMSAAATANLPRIAPVLLSSQGSPAPIGGLTPFNAGSTSSLLGIAASVTPALLPVPSHPVPPKTALDQTATSEFNQETRIEKDRQQQQKSESPQPNQAQKNQPETPILSGMANTKNLKTLQAAITGGGGPPPLLGGQFLPFPLPGTPPMFSPQIQGAYFQQLYGMKKSLFPMNPVIPQTLISLLPNSLVQPEAHHPKQPKLETAPPARSSTPATAGEQLPEADEARVTSEDFLLLQSAGVSTVDVAHKYLCRQCKSPFDEEGQAVTHQEEVCFHRTGAPPPLRVPVCTYHCLACEVLLSGTEALTQHLRSGAHKRETLRKNNSSFAKEEANIPHTDPSPNRASTSVLVAL